MSTTTSGRLIGSLFLVVLVKRAFPERQLVRQEARLEAALR